MDALIASDQRTEALLSTLVSPPLGLKDVEVKHAYRAVVFKAIAAIDDKDIGTTKPRSPPPPPPPPSNHVSAPFLTPAPTVEQLDGNSANTLLKHVEGERAGEARANHNGQQLPASHVSTTSLRGGPFSYLHTQPQIHLLRPVLRRPAHARGSRRHSRRARDGGAGAEEAEREPPEVARVSLDQDGAGVSHAGDDGQEKSLRFTCHLWRSLSTEEGRMCRDDMRTRAGLRGAQGQAGFGRAAEL